MKYFYDTEFIDDGEKIELLSIGIVAEDGREYYAVVKDIRTMLRAWDMKSGNEYWLRKNVVNHLPFIAVGGWSGDWDTSHPDYKNLKTRREIEREVLNFFRYDNTPEYWAWFAAYDHVALSQLWGRMIDLPLGLPMWTNDIKQEHKRLGYPRIPEQAQGAHNALEDARWNKSTYEYLARLDGPVIPLPEGKVSVANPGRTVL